MHFEGLLNLLQRLPAFQPLISDAELPPQSLFQAARPYVVAGISVSHPGPLVLLTSRSEIARQIAEQIEAWLPAARLTGSRATKDVLEGGPAVHLFAEPDALPYERIPWSSAARQQRLTTLAALQSRKRDANPIVIASARSLMQYTLPARELRLALRPVKVGEIIRLDQMTLQWVQTGYSPVDVVEEPGAFARRGGIIDIWPPNLPRPVRIDLFGDEVESLRIFDPASQRTIELVDGVEIGPGSEALSKHGQAALSRLKIVDGRLNAPGNLAVGEDASPLQDPRLLLAIREELRLEVEHLAQGHSFHGIEWYLPYFYEQPASLLDYLADDATLIVDDAADLFATLEELHLQAMGLREELVRSGELPEAFSASYFTPEQLNERLMSLKPLLLGYGDLSGNSASANTPLARSFIPGPRYGGKTKQIVADIKKIRADNHAIVLVSRQAARLQNLLQEDDIIAHVYSELTNSPLPGTVAIVQRIVNEGFVMRGLPRPAGAIDDVSSAQTTPATYDLHFLTDTELFGWSKPRTRRRTRRQSTVAPEIFFADVKAGEFVVHLEHGVGRYEGLVKLDLGGLVREYLQVTYARNDKLYVPVHQAERLSRFVGAGEKGPVVNRLGTADWQTVKERTKRAVADIAQDLLKLYAERELVTGHAYSPDGLWQEELAASFSFEETDDQIVAIEAVKRDMETERPMDRLICGDVGYGKTEVAVRAAFKAITDGKQVAMLVPTTVLAQQHFRTLGARLNQFPVQVEMLSRFRTPAQQEKIVQGLREGRVDLVIGTHRLLSQDLEFKDLGLLIIDEEQRFGVVQKEKLKELRSQVDVLTLSATPIPRTLHMSLSGVRDMSTINTPPKERLPIHTILAEFDDGLVRQAIQREIDRNGQVFFVHNRVRGIQQLADRIQHLIPEASVIVGHGQMQERRLEDVMLRFAEGEYDVLVATTIIENGLDIPNANTMIINRADKFGLAQLYQLRGRVGRSSQRGHCYLLYDKHTPLNHDARRRLAAIMESSEELGAGFRIAMRDLEIRGAGDLLGARQHGHIDSVGFDLYTRLLAQSINEAKAKRTRFERAVQEGNVTHQALIHSDDTSGDTDGAGANFTDLEAPFDVNDPLAPPVLLDLPLGTQIPQTYIEEEHLRLQMYRRIAGMTHLESIDEMRQEMLDRFGADPETKSVPEEVENLFYLIRVKILAVRAGVQNIGRELDQIVIRSEVIENMNRPSMQRRLTQAFDQSKDYDLTQEEAPRVARRAIYLPLDEDARWRVALVRTLEIMAYA